MRVGRTAGVKDGAYRRRAGDIVRQYQETVLTWYDTKTITFSKTRNEDQSALGVLDKTEAQLYLSKTWFCASEA